MEEELEAERQACAKANKQRSDLAKEIDSLEERLDEASGVTTAQVELDKRMDAEVNKLRKEVDHARGKWTPPTCLLVTLQPPRKIAAENSDLLRLVGDLDINPVGRWERRNRHSWSLTAAARARTADPRQWWRSQQNPTRAVTK